MGQPTFSDLFGTGATFNATSQKLEIPLAALQASGLAGTPTALQAYGAVIKNAHTWLNANTDLSVMAASDVTSAAPVIRNSIAKTQFQYAVRFFGPYSAPTLDPDDI